MNKLNILNEIKAFLDGYNEDLKYLVHVEANPNVNYAECIIHPPNEEKRIEKIQYEPFMYMKDLKSNNITLFNNDKEFIKEKMVQYGIKIKKLKTGGQKRLENGFCYKITSTKSYKSIINFFRDGGVYIYEKARDDEGNVIENNKGKPIFLYRHLFYSPKPYEQFLINKKARLFKGFEEYEDIHKLTFDIESTGLRPEISRVFAIGVKDNRGFEIALEVEKTDDDEAEANLIRDFFNTIAKIKPAIIIGHNSEEFDFYYLLGRAKILGIDLNLIPTSLKREQKIKRIPNSKVKIGNGSEEYTATKMWGISIIDTLHAAKQTAAMNSDLKKTNLKYVAKYEKIAKNNRTYIKGEDDSIGRYYHENPIFLANDKNEHIEIPKEFQKTGKRLFIAQQKKKELTEDQYKKIKKHCFNNDPDFVKWYKENKLLENNMKIFVQGKTLLKQYLLDDLYETEKVDDLYNASSFMLAKIVPTIYQRICTMGTASIWNLLLTAWSYEYDIAIPHPDVKKEYSGGLTRCYKIGYTKKLAKIDYASLYPMLQLTWDIFPIFDISNAMKKMLIYMTTTRNIYKKLGRSELLENEEIELLKGIDHETYIKYKNKTLTEKERNIFNVKQLPLKILNNSQYGALGSDVSFNWSDNVCAARITTSGRLELRHAISWFKNFGMTPLLAVTDGVNFHIPDKTKIRISDDGISEGNNEGLIEEMWKYKGETGLNAIIEYFNDSEMRKPYMAADNDGEFVSCLNLSRINYALLEEKKDKKTGKINKKIKLTGNTIKSKVLSEYIEEFIDNGLQLILEGKGYEFVEYYYDYVENLFYQKIPLKKIASKSKYKQTLKDYLNRGVDKNGRKKGKQAHMELVLEERENIAEELFEKHKENLQFIKDENDLTIEDKMKLVDVYMPPEPELDSTIYYVNTGYRKSHGDSQKIKDKKTDKKRFAAKIISNKDLIENPDMTGEYNVDKYINAFNKRVKTILVGFDREIAEKIPARIVRKKVKDEETGKKKERVNLERNFFTKDQLVLKNFDNDDFDESMHLQEKEVNFWNETGFDPRLVWNGFKMYDDMKIYFEIYENALKYLNNKMKKAGKPPIKSRNEKINNGEYVLLKNGSEYSVGYNNGKFIEIIRENVNIPKSNIEKELDKKTKKEEEKRKQEIDNLQGGIANKTKAEIDFENQIKLREKYFPIFKKKFNLPDDMTYDFYQQDTDGIGDEMLDKFIKTEEQKNENEKTKYLGID